MNGENYKDLSGIKKELGGSPKFFSLPKYKEEYIYIFSIIKFFYGVGISAPVKVS